MLIYLIIQILKQFSNNNHNKYYDNLVITWGNEFSFLKMVVISINTFQHIHQNIKKLCGLFC